MEIILLERIIHLGAMGDIVKVKNGFARNFLLPQKKALRATQANREHFKTLRTELESKDHERKEHAEAVALNLSGKSFIIIRSAGERGQLYGSVSTKNIADFLVEKGFVLSRHNIGLNHPIKSTGNFKIPILLHPEVEIIITLNIARSMEEVESDTKKMEKNIPEDLSNAEDSSIKQ